jgi:ribulose-phosphate 3-epimerase
MIKIAPSILAADFAALADEIARVEAGGADQIHVDVMDGHFVPNISIGRPVVEAIRKRTRLPLDLHLMIADPDLYLEGFVKAGGDSLTVHVEACPHLHRTLARIRELGARAGVALNPATPPVALEYGVEGADLVLVMSVNPGFGGQGYLPAATDKLRRARALLDRAGSRAALQVDGGITVATIRTAWEAGADTFVAGTAVFGAPDPARAVEALRRECMARA